MTKHPMTTPYGERYGSANIHPVTGIRYGFIHTRSVNPDASECIYTDGRDLTYESCVADIKSRLTQWAGEGHGQSADLRAFLSDFVRESRLVGYLEELTPLLSLYVGADAKEIVDAVDAAWDIIEDDYNDGYQPDNPLLLLEKDGYRISTAFDGTCFCITESPFYTFCRQCSPCAPNAGDLDNPDTDGVKTYCLGGEWFDDDAQMPYPVYSVATGELVQPV